MINARQKSEKNSFKSAYYKSLGFYVSVAALPVIQFAVFYIYVNFNSISLALKTYDPLTRDVISIGFENFSQIFFNWSNSTELKTAVTNSLTMFAVNTLVGLTCGMLFSYYIFKKMPLYNMFKVFLFLPTIVSVIVMVVIYTYFVDGAIPAILEKTLGVKILGLLSSDNHRTVFGTLVFYNIWVGFGSQVLLYVGAMNGISQSVIEAGKIDGANAVKEFLFIVFPSVYQTFIVFFTVALAKIFTDQMALFSFYGKDIKDERLITIGYYLYEGVQDGTIVEYPYFSAIGIICTLIILPRTLAVRWALNKFGPSED